MSSHGNSSTPIKTPLLQRTKTRLCKTGTVQTTHNAPAKPQETQPTLVQLIGTVTHTQDTDLTKAFTQTPITPLPSKHAYGTPCHPQACGTCHQEK